MLEDGVKEVKLLGEEIAVKARIENVDGFSGHADQPMLLEWLSRFEKKPKKVFLVHGEMDEMGPLAEEIRRRWDLDVSMPTQGESFVLGAPEVSVVPTVDPEVQTREINEEFDRIQEQFQMLEELKQRVDESPKTLDEYESLRIKLLSIQKDLIDIKMILGK